MKQTNKMYKIIKNKKAFTGDLLYWIIYITMTAIVMTLIVTIPYTFLSQFTEVDTLQNKILSQRIFFSSKSRDLLQSPGTAEIIDLGWFDQQKPSQGSFVDLDDSYKKVTFRMTLYKDFDKKHKSKIYNKEFFDIADPLANMLYFANEDYYYTFARIDNQIYPARLSVYILSPKKYYTAD